MKIVNLLGGFGNQMFEYAMYMALKDAHPEEEIKLCTRSFRGYGLHNGLEIDSVFKLSINEASLLQLCQLAYPFVNYKSWQIMRHCLPQRKSMITGSFDIPFDYSQVTRNDSCYYEGYWQNEENFKNIREKILSVYKFPDFTDKSNIELAKMLDNEISVSCHIRRGDYLNAPDLCVCTPDYYTKAITEINSLVSPSLYCIFSDDIQWCREKIPHLIGSVSKIVFVDWNKGANSFRDMQLMSLCNHNIIANSSFSWWGAWLNNHEDKKVISPNEWTNSPIKNSPICKDWIKIKVK